MWLLLWILFVLVIIGVFAWSFHVGHEQKRAWQAFANKYHLQFIKGALTQPPAITGQLKDRLVNVYTQQNMSDARGKTTATIIEVFLNRVPYPISLVSSQGFGDLAGEVQLPEPFNVVDYDWPVNNVIARAADSEMSAIWFGAHKDRIRAIQKLVKIPHDTAFFIGDERSFLVIRTPDPLSDPRALNKLIVELFEIAAMLETDAAPSTAAAPIVDQPQDNITNPNEPSDIASPSAEDEPKL